MDSPEEKNSFCFHDGRIAKNPLELITILEKIDNETFAYHLREGKNDFAVWIMDMGDSVLSERVSGVNSKDGLISVLKEHYTKRPKPSFFRQAFLKLRVGAKDFLNRQSDRIKEHDSQKKKYYSKLIDSFRKRQKEIEGELLELKAKYPSNRQLDIGDQYLAKIRSYLKKFESSKSETDAIELLHLFYSLEEEISGIKGSFEKILTGFQSHYQELKEQVVRLKSKGQNTSECDIDLAKIEGMLSAGIKKEAETINLLHQFYLLEDRIKNLGAMANLGVQTHDNSLDQDQKNIISEREGL